MAYSRPEIISGTTRADKPFFENILDGVDERVSRADADASYARIFPLPDWWEWDFGFPILTDGHRFWTNYDVAARRNRSLSSVYVHTTKGSDATGDGSRTKPFAGLLKAIQAVPEGGTITVLNRDTIFRDRGTSSGTVSKSFNLVFSDPATVVAIADRLTWTATSGQANVFEAVRTNVCQVVDLGLGDPEGVPYSKAVDLATCQSTPGSWFQAADGTGKIYVHTTTNAAPDDNILALLQDGSLYLDTAGRSSDMRVYIEGGRFFGSTRGTVAVSNTSRVLRFTTKNVQFLHSGYGNVGSTTLANGLSILGNVEYYGQRTSVSYTGLDGFNYHLSSGFLPRGVEIDCTAHDNGTTEASMRAAVQNIQNCSTTHDGAPVVRVGGRYWKSFGSIIADVQPGTKSVNFSCESGGSTDPGGNNASFSAQQAGAIIGVYGCITWGTTYNLYAVTGATVYYDGLTEWSTRQGAGTIAPT
ncbi:glycoside hydrolase [Gordonia phage SpeedDemon]|nr:glycoside hydrolase [Gordonia phage SpeedDemon]